MSAFIPVEEAKSLLEKGALVVDVRSQMEWEAGHAEGSLLLPLQELEERYDELPRDRPLLMVCRSGARSQVAADFLRSLGYVEVHNLGPWQRTPAQLD
ncbi:MAG TPA: rhodanese-like domain-containing protein [Holophagaceae bacterium]|nr:rhodanese-like domain-containing protein [Holophagaceae bacterium]